MSETSYICVLLYKSASDAADYVPLYEESYVEVKASTEDEARALVSASKARRETSYKNEAGDKISWTLDMLIDVSEALDAESTDGVREIYSRHFHDIASYKKMEVLAQNQS